MDIKNKNGSNGKRSSAANKNNKKRISKKKKQRADILKKRIITGAVIALIILAAVFALPRGIKALREAIGGNGEESTHEVDVTQVRILSFDTLSTGSSDSRLSAEEFKSALSQLYNAGYVLVDVYDIAQEDETGNLVCNDTINVPVGKKPLIISQQDVSYALNAAEIGTANKLVLKDGEIKAEYTNGDTIQTGDYDIVPILETFIDEHPDFSYNDARAVLGVSGSYGVLGYRTTSYFSSSEEDNPYASYGVFDTKNEAESAKKVADDLKTKGYRFASCGFDADISYGAEYSIVEGDVKSWSNEVEPIVGETNIMLLPRQTDIASWKGYTEDNKKYKLLFNEDFRYYFVGNNTASFMFQAKDGYVRQSIYEISNYTDFENAITAIQ